MTYIFYNPLSNNKKGEEKLKSLTANYKQGEFVTLDITDSENTKKIIDLTEDDNVIFTGGDGTLHHTANHLYEMFGSMDKIRPSVFYTASGSGNDFMHDVNGNMPDSLVDIKPYFEHLPVVEINGKKQRFVNGVGVGIDGYCCENVKRILEKKGTKKINYTTLAIKGLLYDYKPVSIKAVVDGVEKHYSNVWLAPVMNGEYFGGGMKVAPGQDRLNPEKKVMFLCVHKIKRLCALPLLPQFVTGTYVRYTKYVDVISARNISVEFDRPVTLQIDGEAVFNVKGYKVFTDN